MGLGTIAVGIDGSATATDALAWAVGLARAENAAVQALHVWQTPFVCTYPWSSPSTEDEIRHARELVKEAVNTVGVDRHVESIIVRGSAGPGLTGEAADADLLVIGRTGENLVEYTPQFGEIMAGATARYCVNHSERAVATVPPGTSWTAAPQVLIGIDGSPTSLAALRWAMEYLPADAELHAMHAVTLPPPSDSLEAPLDVELLDPLVENYRTELRRLVDENVPAAFVAAGRVVHPHVVLGYANDALTDPGFPCDLIVVGEHGDTAAAPGVLGSVADHTLRHAPVPLIVVPASAVNTDS